MDKQRFIFNCSNGHRFAVDYSVDSGDWVNEHGQRTPKRYGAVRRLCPTCWLEVWSKPLRAKKTHNHCGINCLTARGEECNCECGGENHGAKYLLILKY